MSQASVRRKPNEPPALLDTELEHLPPELRWREWMGRVEAVIFAASEPVPRSSILTLLMPEAALKYFSICLSVAATWAEISKRDAVRSV